VATNEITRAETKQSFLLWFGVLGAPLAWTAQVMIAPDVAEIICYPGATRSGAGEVWGWQLETALILLSAAMLLVALSALVVSLGCLRTYRRAVDQTPGSRARWMAYAGVIVSSLFVIGILLGSIPPLMLQACRVTP
jgi:hypothetical protein